MPAFTRQLTSSRPTLDRLNDSPFRDWAERAATSADVLLQGWTAQELTATGLALEAQLQRRAQAHLGPHQISQAPSTAAAVAQLRWKLTDLQLMDEIDLDEPRLAAGGLRIDLGGRPDDPVLLTSPTQAWHLHGLLALWKLADAEHVLQRVDATGAISEAQTAAELYAAPRLPKHLPHDTAIALASSLVTEAALAAALGYQAFRAAGLEALAAWKSQIAHATGAEQQRQRHTEEQSKAARTNALRSHAREARARELGLQWLQTCANFPSRSAAAVAVVKYLAGEGPVEPHEEAAYRAQLGECDACKFAAVYGWLGRLPPEQMRWTDRRRKRK